MPAPADSLLETLDMKLNAAVLAQVNTLAALSSLKQATANQLMSATVPPAATPALSPPSPSMRVTPERSPPAVHCGVPSPQSTGSVTASPSSPPQQPSPLAKVEPMPSPPCKKEESALAEAEDIADDSELPLPLANQTNGGGKVGVLACLGKMFDLNFLVWFGRGLCTDYCCAYAFKGSSGSICFCPSALQKCDLNSFLSCDFLWNCMVDACQDAASIVTQRDRATVPFQHQRSHQRVERQGRRDRQGKPFTLRHLCIVFLYHLHVTVQSLPKVKSLPHFFCMIHWVDCSNFSWKERLCTKILYSFCRTKKFSLQRLKELL